MQVDQKEKYDEWLPDWDKSLSDDDLVLLDHFNEQRLDTVKRKGIDVTHESEAVSQSEYFMAAAREGLRVQVTGGIPGTPSAQFYRSNFKFSGTEMEVVQACATYLALMKKLVESFVARFGD